MKTIDIDSLDPGYSTEPAVRYKKRRKLTHRQQVELRRTSYVHIQHHSRWDRRLGIKPETMRDWRNLERRMHEIDVTWKEVNDKFWSLARSLPRPKDGVSVVVIDDPASDEDGVLKISEDGYSSDTRHRLVAELLRDPQKEDQFVLIPYDQGGSVLGRLYRRMIQFQRAYGTYKVAFQRAVGDRLNKMKDVMLRHNDTAYGRVYYHPATFLIENENRIYVITSNNSGQITFHEGDVYAAARIQNGQ